MSYATKANVAIISGIAEASINTLFLTIADREVERLCGRSFGTAASKTEYFDIENRNVFIDGDIGSREFALTKHPVNSITSVQSISRYSDINNVIQELTSTLDAEDDYYLWNDDGEGIIEIPVDYELPVGPKALKIVYNYGYATVPNDILDYANYYAAYLAESNFNNPVNATGNPLSEVEIGRYREKYADPIRLKQSKYDSVLKSLEETLILKYKLWD
jgi:hypothetical protein